MIKLIDIINELKIIHKIGNYDGGEANMYNFINKPYKIIKLYKYKDDNRLKEIISIMEKSKDNFAKIYKIDYKNNFIIQEKLNTNKVTKLIYEITDFLLLDLKLPKLFLEMYRVNKFIDILYLIREDICLKKSDLINYLRIKLQYNNSYYLFFNDMVNLLNNLNNDINICNLDIHFQNIGYDAKGKLKLFDI